MKKWDVYIHKKDWHKIVFTWIMNQDKYPTFEKRGWWCGSLKERYKWYKVKMYNSFWNFTVKDITRNYIKQKSLSYDL